jgi:hypothetical protein
MLAGGAAAGVGTLLGGRPATAAPTGTPGPLRVRIVLFDGVEEQDFIAPQEVFSLAGWYSPRKVDTGYMVLGRPRLITAAFGTRVVVDRGWRPDDADLIVVPGGGRPGEPGIWAEINGGVLPKALAAPAAPDSPSRRSAPARSSSRRPAWSPAVPAPPTPSRRRSWPHAVASSRTRASSTTGTWSPRAASRPVWTWRCT